MGPIKYRVYTSAEIIPLATLAFFLYIRRSVLKWELSYSHRIQYSSPPVQFIDLKVNGKSSCKWSSCLNLRREALDLTTSWRQADVIIAAKQTNSRQCIGIGIGSCISGNGNPNFRPNLVTRLPKLPIITKVTQFVEHNHYSLQFSKTLYITIWTFYA
jgi:hypothetical protein